MRKALKIVSTIYLILLPLAILNFVIGGIVFIALANNPDIYQSLTEQWQVDSVYWTLVAVGIVMFVLSACYVPGIVFTAILRKKSEDEPKPGKAELITFGVLGFVFGSTATGIIAVIWAFLHDEDKPVDAAVENVVDPQ